MVGSTLTIQVYAGFTVPKNLAIPIFLFVLLPWEQPCNHRSGRPPTGYARKRLLRLSTRRCKANSWEGQKLRRLTAERANSWEGQQLRGPTAERANSWEGQQLRRPTAEKANSWGGQQLRRPTAEKAKSWEGQQLRRPKAEMANSWERWQERRLPSSKLLNHLNDIGRCRNRY